ncbi:tyrosine-type recombinase/integrase [Dysgonomonas macrotermitis]|uniref:Site-specific recombinase XerD n=1 Tax=Dysgonomonas macrotermitis TaxID=1346286 RepID=A0A1M5DBJ6_9BACT|nr:tyrosine-type recombinase/integrase [Dysgonomonas macrotermitis]SHF64418.1 Site-specific recombinase XerD [Dysgonomonas macrotermitis]
MGRRKADRPTGKFKLRTDQTKCECTDKKKCKCKFTLYLEYTLNRKFAKTTTEYKFASTEWDGKNQKVKGTVANYNRINAQLAKLKNGIDKDIIDYLDNTRGNTKRRLTIDILRAIVQRKPLSTLGKIENDEFFAMAKQLQETNYSQNKIGISKYENNLCQINMFQRFVKQETKEDIIKCNEIDIDLINGFIKWKQEKGNKPVTINKALFPIKETLELASIKGLASAEMVYLISKSYLPEENDSVDKEDDDVKYLTEEQLQILLEIYPTLNNERTREILDMFLFSVHTGLRISDIVTLKWSQIDFETRDIKNKIIIKGRKSLSIPLTSPSLKILEKWKITYNHNVYVFGLLPDNFDLNNDKLLKDTIGGKNRTILQSLKVVGKKMDLPFTLTMHKGRHTYAVLAINRDVSLHKLSLLLGHGSIMVTEKVYAEFLPTTIKEEVETKLDFNFLPDGY